MTEKKVPENLAQASQLFMLRIWHEAMGNGWTDWRGSVQHVNSGEVRYLHEWSTLEGFVEGLMKRAREENKKIS